MVARVNHGWRRTASLGAAGVACLAGASRLRAKQERIIGLLARWMAKE